jgi:hypothetical protein
MLFLARVVSQAILAGNLALVFGAIPKSSPRKQIFVNHQNSCSIDWETYGRNKSSNHNEYNEIKDLGRVPVLV